VQLLSRGRKASMAGSGSAQEALEGWREAVARAGSAQWADIMDAEEEAMSSGVGGDVVDGGGSSGSCTPPDGASLRASREASPVLRWRDSQSGSQLRRWTRLATKLRAACVAQWLVKSKIKSLGSVPHVSGKPCRPCDFHKKGKCFDGVTCRFCHEDCGHTVMHSKTRKCAKRHHEEARQRQKTARADRHRHEHSPEAVSPDPSMSASQGQAADGVERCYNRQSPPGSPAALEQVEVGWSVSEDRSVNPVPVHPLLAQMLRGPM